MNLIITGGHGFIGRQLIERLPDHIKIWSVVRNKSQKTQVKNEKMIDLSIPQDCETLRTLRDIKVIHLASHYVRNHTQDNVPELLDSLLSFGIQLLDSLPQNESIQFVNIGSSYEHHHGIQDQPFNLYAALKISFRQVLKLYPNVHPVQLKFFDVYGPRDPRGKVVDLLVDSFYRGSRLKLGSPDQEMNLVHSHDIVSGLLHSLEVHEDLIPGHYALASSPITLSQLVSLLSLVSGKKANIEWGMAQHLGKEVGPLWKSYDLLPGWVPKVRIEEGLRELWKLKTMEEQE